MYCTGATGRQRRAIIIILRTHLRGAWAPSDTQNTNAFCARVRVIVMDGHCPMTTVQWSNVWDRRRGNIVMQNTLVVWTRCGDPPAQRRRRSTTAAFFRFVPHQPRWGMRIAIEQISIVRPQQHFCLQLCVAFWADYQSTALCNHSLLNVHKFECMMTCRRHRRARCERVRKVTWCLRATRESACALVASGR